MWKNPDTVVQSLFNHFCLWINDTWKFHSRKLSNPAKRNYINFSFQRIKVRKFNQ